MKKFLSVLMTAVLLLTCLPLNVFVANTSSAAKTEDKREIKRYTVLVLDVASAVGFVNVEGELIYLADPAIKDVKISAHRFLDQLAQADGENHVAVIAYNDKTELVSDFTTNFTGLNSKIDALKVVNGYNDVNGALTKADNLLAGVNFQDAVKNVVLVTTGMVNAGDYDYEGVFDISSIGSNWKRANTGVRLFAYANTAIEAAEKLKENATIYVLGLFQSMEEIPQEGQSAGVLFKNTAKKLASKANTFYDVTDPSQLEFAFGSVIDNITACEGKFKYRGQINKTGNSIAKYHYSDTYFMKDSAIYNESLSTMSLCMELACWPAFTSFDEGSLSEKMKNSNNDGGWYSEDETEDSDKFWRDDDHLRNIKELFYGSPDVSDENPGIGFSHFQANTFWQKPPENNSIGVCAARKQIQDRDGKQYTLIALPIRGGSYGSEWASNFTIGNTGEHKGFAEARDNVIAFLYDYLKTLSSDESKDIKLWITGYSRAGATANMVAGKLDTLISNKQFTFPNDCKTTIEDIYCYTFEAPQGTVKSNLPDYDNEKSNPYRNIHNIVNPNDPIPLVMPNSWDFARYNNENDHILPSACTSDSFLADRLSMFLELNKLGFGPNNWNEEYLHYNNLNLDIKNTFNYKYLIDEYQIDFFDTSKSINKISKLKQWLDQGNVYIDTHTVLQNGTDVLIDVLFTNRQHYAEIDQEDFCSSIGYITDYYGKLNGVNKATIDAKNELSELFYKYFTEENIIYIIEPIFSFSTKNLEERQKTCEGRLSSIVGEMLAELVKNHVDIKDIIEISTLNNALTNILRRLLIDVTIDCYKGNESYSFNATLRYIWAMIIQRFQGHYPEITLAWVRSQDPFFYTEPREKINSTVTRFVCINCPVDIEVYDSNNNLRAAIINNEPDQSIDFPLINYINENGEKILCLPGDETYDVRITASDDGEVNYSISEIDYRLNSNTRLENYYNIPIKKGDILNANVPEIAENELNQSSEAGSTVVYTLNKNGYELKPDEVIMGCENIASAKYNVTLKTEGNGGYAYGAGRNYLKGSFAQMGVSMYPNGEFLGWYDGNKLISSDLDYRFAVKNDTELTARFNELEFRSFTLDVDGKGNINQEEGSYPADIEIELKAEPEEGYEFVNWTSSNGGTFDNDKNSETIFTMPDHDTMVIAHFRKIGAQTTSTTTTTTTTATTTTTTTTTKKTTTTSQTTATTVTTSAAVTTTTTAPANEKKLGDITGNGIIDAVDASMILAMYAALSTGKGDPTEEEVKICDVDGNGEVNAVDASKVLAYYAYTSTGGDMSIKEFLKE